MATNAKNLAELLNTDTTVKVGDIEDGSVTTAKLAADAVTAAKLADNSVVTANIVDGNVTAVKTTGVGKAKNLVINGAMKIAQRTTSSAGLGANSSAQFVVDRIFTNSVSDGRYTASQNTVTDLPGFTKALKLDCTTADTSIAAGEYLLLQYRFEGQDLQQLKKGTSSAEAVTLSFYVKGNAAATYTAELYDYDNTRQYSQRFNVTTSWNRISLTYTGDTTGAYDDDNENSLLLVLWLHAGANYTGGTQNTAWGAAVNNQRANSSDTSFFDSTNRTFEITGLQLEVGDTVSDFEHRSFAEDLRLCQRYYQEGRSKISTYRTFSGNWEESLPIIFSTTMRANPTMAKKTVHTSSRLNGHDCYYPQLYGFCHFAYPSSSGQYISDFTWYANAEL